MPDVPGHDPRNAVGDGGLADQAIAKSGADAAALRVASGRREGLGRGQTDKRGDGADALQRRPSLLGRELEWRALASAGQGAVRLGVTMRGDSEPCRAR